MRTHQLPTRPADDPRLIGALFVLSIFGSRTGTASAAGCGAYHGP
ncbi:DUF7503 family protein [Halorarum salinum]|nr:hypothetical protein [Halobaculum salinum]